MFGELLAYLRQHGFHIGVDHYLRLQQLLDKIGGHCSPQELRTLLCPIFATSKTQQEQFYRAFDSYFDFFQSDGEPSDAEQLSEAEAQQPLHALPSKSTRRKWLYVAATAAVLTALALALFLFLRPRAIEQPSTAQTNTSASPDATAATSTPETIVQSSPDVAGVNEAPVQGAGVQTSIPTPTPEAVPTPESSFYERHRSGINIAIILAPLLLFLLYEWYRFTRRKLLIQKQQARKPPFIWPVQVDAPEDGLYDSEQFLTAARLLRRRQVDEFRRLDVEATVAATIEQLGFPDFRYKSDSRFPEYLVLIDRASYRDHQAQLFDELTQALTREGVFAVRYFFDGDPRVCRDETGASVVQLTELQNRFGGHRLIIFGGGDKLLDQITGRLDGWTSIFNYWQDRALLTVESPARWGLREMALAQLFIVLPATLHGLLALVDHFETTVPADLREWMRGSSGSDGMETNALQSTPEEMLAQLRRILGEDAFQWLSACAIYTELQWNLTLYIGSLPSMPQGLLTEANLLKLIRLPWFRTGAIPDELRWFLINELAPERQRAVRAALIELLEKDPAPPETFASDHYRLNLFAQRWLARHTRKRLRELMRLIKQLPRSQVVRDLTLIRFLEADSRSPLNFLLPDRLRKLFYHRGVPAFGLKTATRFALTLFLITGAWVGVSLLTPPPVPHVSAKSLETPSVPSTSEIDETDAATPPATPQDENSNAALPTVAAPPVKRDLPSWLLIASIFKGQKPETFPTSETKNGRFQGSATGQNTEASAPVEVAKDVSKVPALPVPVPGGRTDGKTERGVTSVFGIVNNTPETRQNPIQNDEPPPPLKPTPVPTPSAKIVVSGGVLNAKALSLPRPVYPPEAIAARASGKVIVQVMLDESGKVISASAIKGPYLFQQAAVRAAYRARFSPTIVNGQPVNVSGIINYNFEFNEPLQQPDRMPQPGGRPTARPGGGRPPRK
jgi:TonB family protein